MFITVNRRSAWTTQNEKSACFLISSF